MSRRTTSVRRVAAFALPWSLAAALCLRAVEPAPAAPPAPPPLASAVRLKFQDFVKDKARLESLIRAVEVMKARSSKPHDSAEYRASWEYWTAIHGHYGSQAKAGLLADTLVDIEADKKVFYEGIHDLERPAEPAGLAAEVWDQCTHSDMNGKSLEFLTWHRVFLYFFERVLQDAAKDKTLRLPYWDYTDPGHVQLPAEFAQPELSPGRSNPLYDARRSAQTVTLDPDATDIDRVLEKTSFSDFSGEVEQQPHGTVHCTVAPGCPNAVMGDVPISANDPIFWFHHANIDRIFECWLKRGGTVPEDVLAHEYTFVDPAGAKVRMKVADLWKAGGPIDYTYDNVANCSRQPLPPLAPVTETEAKTQTVTEVAAVENFAIPEASEAVKLPLPRSGAPAERLEKALAAGTGNPGRVELVLDGITFAGPPRVLFKVYLGTTGENPRRQYVATLGFFVAKHHGGHGGQSLGGGMPGRVVDVTEALQGLRGADGKLPDLQVEVVATEGTAGATLAAARARFNRNAGLKIGSIHLRVRGGA
jgi:hypothetical protein